MQLIIHSSLAFKDAQWGEAMGQRIVSNFNITSFAALMLGYHRYWSWLVQVHPHLDYPQLDYNPYGLTLFGLPPFRLTPFGLTPFWLTPFWLRPFGLPPFGLPHRSQVPWGPNFIQNGDPMGTQFWVIWGPNGDLHQHKWASFGAQVCAIFIVLSSQVIKWSTLIYSRCSGFSSAWNGDNRDLEKNGDLLKTQIQKRSPIGPGSPNRDPLALGAVLPPYGLLPS